MAALTTIAAIAALTAATASTVKTLTAKPVKSPDMPQLPAPPSLDMAAITAAATKRRQAQARGDRTPDRSGTLLTGSGIGTATTARSTLLGM